MHSSERVAQEVELSFRHLADACLLFVDREPQLTHDLAQSLQRLFGSARLAQDHEIIGVGNDPTAEASAASRRGHPSHRCWPIITCAGSYWDGRCSGWSVSPRII